MVGVASGKGRSCGSLRGCVDWGVGVRRDLRELFAGGCRGGREGGVGGAEGRRSSIGAGAGRLGSERRRVYEDENAYFVWVEFGDVGEDGLELVS
jgi:hypothetical protein